MQFQEINQRQRGVMSRNAKQSGFTPFTPQQFDKRGWWLLIAAKW